MLIFTLSAPEGASAMSTADDGLMARIAAGDEDAFRELYDKTHGGVYGFALSITKNTHDAEDVLQDTFLTVHQKAGEYIPRGKPMAWIFTIARNHALTRLRAAGREAPLEEAENRADLSMLDDPEERMTVRAALESLDGGERQVLMLHAAGGLKNREIAEVMGLPLGTVLAKYHRAAKKLRKRLEEEGF